MAEVVLEHISKNYDDFFAVKNADFVIEDGSFVVLVGPSGCGKSTTLRIIAGLETPSEGRIIINGRDVTKMEPKDRNVAMVFQSYALYPHMNVFDNMAFALRAGSYTEGNKKKKLSKQEIKDRVTRAAELLGIEDQLGKKPKQLSGGQRQRVAVGRTLVRQPSVFLMDEPLSNLDAKLRTKMRVELKNLHQKLGATIVYVTHDQKEAMTLADKIAVINKGQILQYASPLETYNSPADSFVASFIGSPSMNLIEGSLKPHPKGYRFKSRDISFDLPLPVAKAVYKSQLSSSEITYGIRPGNINAASEFDENIRSNSKQLVEARIFGMEALGSRDIVFARKGVTELSAEVKVGSGLNIGDNCLLDLSSSKAHIFKKDGRAVC